MANQATIILTTVSCRFCKEEIPVGKLLEGNQVYWTEDFGYFHYRCLPEPMQKYLYEEVELR